MNQPAIYLAGPISGLSYKGAVNWREYVETTLAADSIRVLNPLRWHEFLSAETFLTDEYVGNPLSEGKGIVAKDRLDVMRSDCVMLYLLGAQRVTIGSMIELGWADAFRKPVILVMEPKNNLHEHSMVREMCPFRVDNLDEAIAIARSIL